jgi:dihydroneopterin aldolase
LEVAAPQTDDIADTIDYAKVCDVVVRAATSNTYNLLERLASVVCDELLANFPLANKAKVRAYKPAPPIPHPVGDVSVMVKRNRPKAAAKED